MAKVVSLITLGIDVSKAELVIADQDSGELTTLVNDPAAIRSWLSTLAGPVRLALEPTGRYHLDLADLAHAAGCEVYLVNARQLAHYRKAVDVRHKSDPADALLLARYLAHEAAALRPYHPQHPAARELWSLINQRATVVRARQNVNQSLAGGTIGIKGLMSGFKALLRRLDRRMQALIHTLGWEDDYQRCLSIPGIGPLNAAALVTVFRRGAFANQNAFIAYLGWDVRLRESGSFRGKRKLTKQGPAELRRLLYCAAQPARNHPPFADYHQRQLAKGLPKIAANCILARKLARTAFGLMSRQEIFRETAAAY